jgi:hypothetical protein
MICIGARAACRGGVVEAILACLFMTMITTRAMNVAHVVSGLGEQTGTNKEKVSLETELHNLLKELDEHRGTHYHAEHARMVEIALDSLRQNEGRNRARSSGSRHSKKLRSDIQRALDSMPLAMEKAGQGLQAAQERGLLNRSLEVAQRRGTSNTSNPHKDTFWMEQDPKYRYCGKYAFQVGAAIEWGLMSPDEGVPKYGADPNFMVTMMCVADHGNVLGIFDAVTCPLCLMLNGVGTALARKSNFEESSGSNEKASLLELDHRVVLQDRVIRSSVELYQKLRNTGILDEINFKTPLTLGFEWPRWFEKNLTFPRWYPDILLATTIGADWLAQPGYYNETKWWPIRGAGLTTYDAKSPDIVNGLSLEWALWEPTEDFVASPDPNIIMTLSSSLPWDWPAPLNYALNFEWPRTQEAEQTKVYKNWMPEVLFGIGAGYELKSPSDAFCQPVHCPWCLVTGECKDDEEVNGLSDIFDDSTAGKPACHAMGGIWCKPCYESNWEDTSLEGCGYTGDESMWEYIFGKKKEEK